MFKKLIAIINIIILSGQIAAAPKNNTKNPVEIYSIGEYTIYSEADEKLPIPTLSSKDKIEILSLLNSQEGGSFFVQGIIHDILSENKNAKPLAQYRTNNASFDTNFFIFLENENEYQIVATKLNANLDRTTVICSTEKHNTFQIIFNSKECQSAFNKLNIITDINSIIEFK